MVERKEDISELKVFIYCDCALHTYKLNTRPDRVKHLNKIYRSFIRNLCEQMLSCVCLCVVFLSLIRWERWAQQATVIRVPCLVFAVATIPSTNVVTMFNASIEMSCELFIKSMRAIYMSSTNITIGNKSYLPHSHSKECRKHQSIYHHICNWTAEIEYLFSIFTAKPN